MSPNTRSRRSEARAMFLSIPRSMTRPCCLRSSGTNASPAAMAALGSPVGSTRPSTVTVPPLARSMPKIARATSLRPAPTSPASATISPRLTSNEMSENTPARLSPSTLSITSPGFEGVLGYSVSSSRPTIALMMTSTVIALTESVRTNAPSRMIVIRWQEANTSSSRCEMNRTAAPPSRRVAITSNNRATSTEVRAAVGSSITSTLASVDNAFAISTICWSATDRPRAWRSGSRITPSRAKISAAARFIELRSIRRPLRTGWRPM